ncbi:MAG: hypothetical protein ACE147_06875 [Candidatus Methylomirabilales bacterium]
MRRKLVVAVLLGGLLLTLVPADALARNRHGGHGGSVWTGIGIGVGSVILGGVLLHALTAPAYSAPPVISTPPPVVYTVPPAVYAPPPTVYAPPPPVYAPPPVVQHRWVPGHYEDRWVPTVEWEPIWVEGHYENGTWVPGYWKERVREGGYWTRVWVEGGWR